MTDRVMARRWAVLILVAASALPALGAAAQDAPSWPMYRADPAHTGVCASDIPPDLELLWSRNISSSRLTSPVVSGGRIFAGSADGNLYAVWAETGGEAWRFRFGDEVAAEPAVDGDAVYSVSREGRLCALGAAKGDLLWETRLPHELEYSIPLTLAGDSLYIATPVGTVLRVSTADKGRVLWTHDAGAHLKGPVTVGEGQVFGLFEGGRVTALDAGTGDQSWTLRPGTGGSDEFSSALFDGRLYFGTKGTEVFCLNTTNGSVQWTTAVKSTVSGSPALGYGMMVLGTESGQVVALNISSGRQLWTFDVGGNVTISPSMAGGTVVLGNERGGIYVLRASTGQMVRVEKAGGSRISSPAIAGGLVVFTTVDGGVLVFGKPAVVKPVARLDVSPEKATAGDPVRFSARNSTGAGGLPAAAFLFDFGDGNSSGWVDLPTVEHGYAGVGNYTASLRVNDTSGITSNETILTVVVDNLRPYGVSPGGPLIAYAGRPVIFHPHGSDPDGYIARYEIDFDGDGVIDASGDDLPANLTHLYSGNGTFRPTLTVYDDAGARASASEDLWVRDAARPPVQNPPPAAVSLPVAAASVSVVALAAAGAGLSLTEFGKYRFLTIFFVPLYVRLKKDEVLDNYVRGQIHGYIIANPGDHYNSIRDALELSNGIVAHHLHTLEREGLVQSMRDGMYRRFFPANAKLPPEDEGHFNIQKRIVAIIRDNPGISQKEIAQKVGVSSPTVNYHVGVLATARMIRVEKFGRRTHCYVIDQQPQN